MTRNLKALGLSLLALCAFGAVAASSASAGLFTTPELAANENSIVTGEQVGEAADNVFGVKGAALTTTCKKATYGGTVSGNSVAEATVRPTYFECTAGGGASPVDVNGCALVLKATTTDSTDTEGKAIKTAGATLQCEGTNEIIITAPGCKIGIGTTHPDNLMKPLNHSLDGITYKNEGTTTTRDIKVTVETDSITYTSEGALCGVGGLAKTGTNAFLTTTVTVKAFKHTGGLRCPEGFDNFGNCESANQTALVHDD